MIILDYKYIFIIKSIAKVLNLLCYKIGFKKLKSLKAVVHQIINNLKRKGGTFF